ncbi:hypothetical protein A2U01_0023850, partial [Trifolium medium]|nr:hypothetical protein [Trifolium medium]
SASSVKDANYYINLIRQHGADGHDMQDSQIAQRGAGMVPIAPFSMMFQLSQKLFAEICVRLDPMMWWSIHG